MDPQRLKQAFQKLESLDDRLSYKIRSGSSSLSRQTVEQLEERHRHLAEFTLELKDILRETILALGSRPKPPAPTP
ncbi:MAG: hypothetical protein KDD47_00540 [Acidobacteria bacterium]|nr:hypothetical protein [Acidobacteriota bacterium]